MGEREVIAGTQRPVLCRRPAGVSLRRITGITLTPGHRSCRLASPGPERLRGAAQRAGDEAPCRPGRATLRPVLLKQPDSPLADLLRLPIRSRHGRILSRNRSSWIPATLQEAIRIWREAVLSARAALRPLPPATRLKRRDPFTSQPLRVCEWLRGHGRRHGITRLRVARLVLCGRTRESDAKRAERHKHCVYSE